jgi:hypothetical protein
LKPGGLRSLTVEKAHLFVPRLVDILAETNRFSDYQQNQDSANLEKYHLFKTGLFVGIKRGCMKKVVYLVTLLAILLSVSLTACGNTAI